MKHLHGYFVTCSCNLTTLFQFQNGPVDWVGWRPWQTGSMDMEGNWCGLFQGMPTGRVFVSSDLSVPIFTAEQPASCVGGPAEYGRRWSWGTQLLGSVSVLSFRSLKAFICNHKKVKHFFWGGGEKRCLNLTAEEPWFDSWPAQDVFYAWKRREWLWGQPSLLFSGCLGVQQPER